MENLHGILVTHKRAAVDELESVRVPDPDALLRELTAAGAAEAFVLQTCNRAEFYVRGPEDALDECVDLDDVADDAVSRPSGQDVAEHLFRVASGLESMVLGEDEILGQLSDAYEGSVDYMGGSLQCVVEKAVQTGKRVRSETKINEGNTSMGSAAATVAAENLGDLEDTRTLVIGAGEMGRLIAKPLVDRGADVVVTNRTYETAKALADELGADAICYDAIDARIEEYDLVATATDAPHPILGESDLEGETVMVLDLANPRDVTEEAAALDGVDVVDIDDIGQTMDVSHQMRAEAAERAEAMVDERIDVLEREVKKQRADEMLSTIYNHAEEIREGELEQAMQKLEANTDISGEDRAVVESLMDDLTGAIVKQLLSTPTQSIKGAAAQEEYETLQAIADVFQVSEPVVEERA